MKTIVLFGVQGSGKDTVGHYLHLNYDFRPDSFAYPLKKMVTHAFGFSEEDLFGPSSNRERQYEKYPFAQGLCLSCGMDPTSMSDDRGGYWQSCDRKGRHIKGQEASEEDYVRCSNCSMVYPKNLSPRIALQTLGTEWGRRLYKNVWVDAAFDRIRAENHFDDVQGNMLGTAPQDLPPARRWVLTDGRFVNEHARCVELGATTVLLLRKLDESTDTHASEAEVKLIPRESFQYVLDNRGPLEDLPGLVDEMMVKLGFTR